MITQSDWKEFVVTWQTSNSKEEVAQKLKLSPTQVASRAQRLRKLGVPLNSMRRHLNLKRLIELAEKESDETNNTG